MKQASLILALAGLGFAVVLAAFIGSRLNEQTVALLAGTTCGVGLATPLGVAIGWYVRGRRAYDLVPPSPPPPIVIMPQPPPPSAPNFPLLPTSFAAAPPRRSFTIIGDTGFDDEKK